MIEYKGKSCADAFCGSMPFCGRYVGFFGQIEPLGRRFPQTRPVFAFLHTFCGQQCAQAPQQPLKLLILSRKALAASELGSACAIHLSKVLHGICG
jgi:hypothetical protein